MTAPIMLPGFWDQNGAALTQLAQTITRTVNPYFDSQVALMEGIRKNPAAMSQVVDMAYLNPDMFAQQFGPRMLQRFSQGRPSVEARTQEAQSGMFDQNPDEAPVTTGNMAAQVGLGIGTNQTRKATEVGIRGAELSNEGKVLSNEGQAISNAGSRLELEFANLKAPIERARIQRINQALTDDQAGALGVFNYMDMAKRFVEGQESGRPDPQLDSQLQIMRTMNEEAYPLFQEYVDLYAAKKRDEAASNRQERSFGWQEENDDDVLTRQIKAAARELQLKFPGSFSLTEAESYYTEGSAPESFQKVTDRLVREEGEVRKRDRYMEFFKLTDQYKRITTTRGAERDLIRSNIGTSLSRILGVNVSIERVDKEGSMFGKESAYVLGDGTRLTGEEIRTLIDDPTQAGRFQTRNRIMNMSAEELASEEAAITEAEQVGMYTAGEASYYKNAIRARRDALARTRGR